MPDLLQNFLFLPIWAWIVVVIILIISIVAYRNLEFEGVNFNLGLTAFRFKRRQPKQQSAPTTRPNTSGELLDEIRFDYTDSPTRHGWSIGKDKGATEPTFKHIVDGFVGRAIEIQPNAGYDMNFTLPVLVQMPTVLVFVAKYISKSVFYAGVKLESGDGSTSREGWLAVLEGSGPPEPVKDKNQEWEIFLRPVRHEGDWAVFRVDLADQFRDTFAGNGWVFKGLHGFRIRGHTGIAKISVLG